MDGSKLATDPREDKEITDEMSELDPDEIYIDQEKGRVE